MKEQARLRVIEFVYGTAVAAFIAAVFYQALSWQRFEHSALVFIGLPAILAVAAALLPRPATAKGAIVRATTVALLLSSIVFGEGFVCIVFAAPLFYGVGLLIGVIIDYWGPGRDEPPRALSCVLLLAFLPFSLEGVVRDDELARYATVTVERVVDGSPAEVEATLSRTPRFDRPLPAFFTRFRFPMPGKTSGEGLQVGDRRAIEFLHSAHNAGHHPGVLTLEVREREARHVQFAMPEDTSYLTHWLSWSYADVRWAEIAPGRTCVTWTLRYRRRLDPAWYFAPLERYGVGLAAGYLIDTLATPSRAPARGRDGAWRGALMDAAVAIRAMALYLPMLLVVGAARLRPSTRRARSAAMLACIWNIPTLLIVHELATRTGWWSIHAHGGALVLGLPIELLVGWMLLWGALPIILAPRVPLVVIVAAALAFDLWAMPRCAPVVTLGPRWLIGEGVALALCLIPAQLFARWTRDDRRLAARATLQVICFAALTLWLAPTVVFERVGSLDFGNASGGVGGWGVLWTYDRRWLQIALQLVACAALPGVSAVQEFAQRGGGTPVPFDPPRRLVTSGIYAYVANPMQCSAVLTLVVWGGVLHSWWVAGAAVMTLVYGAGLAAWDEGRDLAERFGDRWRAYRREVHNWRPRWRPYIPVDVEPARLYVAFTCGKCSEVGTWVQRRRPLGLRIVRAEHYPSRDLWRMTYVPGGAAANETAVEEAGIAALARALEHMHLGWALAGMFLRLPLIRPCVQAIVDLSGGGPQRVARVCEPLGR